MVKPTHLLRALPAMLACLSLTASSSPQRGQTPSGGRDEAVPLILRPNSIPEYALRDWQRKMSDGLPLLVGLHPDGGTAAALAGTFQYLADRMLFLAALPQAQSASGTGFRWGSADNAEARVLDAIKTAGSIQTAGSRNVVNPDQVLLIGFSESASLACILGLRQTVPIAGVVAVGPSLENTDMADMPKPKRMPRVVVLCAEDDRGVERCRGTATLLEGFGVPVRLQMLDAESARAGRERLGEAIKSALKR